MRIGILIFLNIISMSFMYAQTTYQSISSGNWNDVNTWDSQGIPPDAISAGDSILILHSVTYSMNKVIQGVLCIDNSGSLSSASFNISIGKNAVNKGKLNNHGSLMAYDLSVMPSFNCNSFDTLPRIENWGVLNVNHNMTVGEECGAGSLQSYIGSDIVIADELMVSGSICLEDSIIVGESVEMLGGVLDCCGFIETPKLKIEGGGSVPSVLGCINICQEDGTNPDFEVAGYDYADLNDAYLNASASDVVINDSLTSFCGYSQDGNRTLPIILSFFKAESFGNHQVMLTWETTSEHNNEFFTLEKSDDKMNWKFIAIQEGAGTSTSANKYSYTDETTYFPTTYYRLKQTDFDGNSKYSSVLAFMSPSDYSSISVFPNPTDKRINILGNSRDFEVFQLLDLFGRNVENMISIILIKENLIILDLSSLPEGVYTLRTRNNVNKIYKL